MNMNNPYHICLGLFGYYDLEDTVNLVKKAEALELDACWIFEDYFYGGAFSTATACALNTKKIQIAIGVINPFTRHPVLSAMEAATVDKLSKGRFILGMGGSNAGWIENGCGIPFEKPISAACEAAEIIKTLVNTKHIHYQGEIFNTGNIQLEFETYRNTMPVYLGVKGPRALYRAGQIADGVVLSSCTSVPYVKYAVEQIAKGAKSMGRHPSEVSLAAYFPTAVAASSQEAYRLIRPYLAKFIGIHGYHPILFEAGLTKEQIKPFKDALIAGNTADVIPLVTDEMVELFAIAGTPKQCQDRLEDICAAGISMPIAFILPQQNTRKFLDGLEKVLNHS